MGYAGGHTHPRRVENTLDHNGNIAKNRFNDGKISYVITCKDAYAIEWTNNKPRKRQQSIKDFVCQ